MARGMDRKRGWERRKNAKMYRMGTKKELIGEQDEKEGITDKRTGLEGKRMDRRKGWEGRKNEQEN